MWTKRPLGKGPLSGFSILISYVAHDEGQYNSSVKWKDKNQLVIFYTPPMSTILLKSVRKFG